MMFIRLLLIVAFWCSVLIPDSSGGVINLFIEAQKQVIAREEALLKQAQTAVKDRIDHAFDTAHEALMNVASQVHHFATYPFRAGNEMIEQSMNMLGNATSSLAGILPSFGSRTNETTTARYPGEPQTAETSIIDRVQQMGEQISRLSNLRVVMHPASEATSSGPTLEIGFDDKESTGNGTGSANENH